MAGFQVGHYVRYSGTTFSEWQGQICKIISLDESDLVLVLFCDHSRYYIHLKNLEIPTRDEVLIYRLEN